VSLEVLEELEVLEVLDYNILLLQVLGKTFEGDPQNPPYVSVTKFFLRARF